ncbi:hypothetical protein L1S35_05315 [Flavobacterium sp. AS60]|uniref:hypothetical protein n=1 Tax=Flavobacterium anseongense TaxID=2910677 RepID=UPI001F27FC15|nr:hypothetical protein [Flavobacterium sp. AS60]MCF6129084.1 hypothetical protein [Flavobacterium sp. AS60]
MTRIIFLALLISFSSFAQLRKELPFTKDSDTTYWMKYRNKTYEAVNENDIFFRLQTPCVSIEVSKTKGNIKGTVEFFAREIDEFKDSTSVFKRKFNFDSDTTLRIFKLIDSLKINSIPSDKYIPRWQQGFDGITYIIEYKDSIQHSFKNYWTPKAQDNLEEAVRIQNFVNRIYTLVNSEKLSAIFQNEIPFRCWTCNLTCICRGMTREQYKEYKKMKRKFRKQNGS